MELAELGAQGDGPEGSEALREEAQDWRGKPGGEIRYLNDYASRWESASMEVPRFYRAAVQRDAREGTGIAWRMRCRIQLIGNYASISDGKFVPSERETVARYVAFLEEFADGSRARAPADLGAGSGENGGGRPALPALEGTGFGTPRSDS